MTPGYSEWVTKLGVGLIVLTPLAKYGLMLNPVNLTGELWLASYPSIENWCNAVPWHRTCLGAVVRILVSLLVVYIATVFPGFDRVVVSAPCLKHM